MRPLRALGIYTAFVFLGAALLAPWTYRLAQSLADTLPGFAEVPFENHVINGLLILALAGMWPLLKALGATSLRDTGLANPAAHGKELLGGILLGLISLAVVAVVAVVLGGRQIEADLTETRLIAKLSGVVLTAAAVAVIEETLFRGGIFGGLRRAFPWSLALLISSVIYAGMHFLHDAEYVGAVTWISGLELLPRLFGGDAPWSEVVPRFLNLTVAGALLALAYQRTGNLWFSIGLHAGWIFWLGAYRIITTSVPDTTRWFWGSGKMIDGWLALIALTLALALFARSPWGKGKSSTS